MKYRLIEYMRMLGVNESVCEGLRKGQRLSGPNCKKLICDPKHEREGPIIQNDVTIRMFEIDSPCEMHNLSIDRHRAFKTIDFLILLIKPLDPEALHCTWQFAIALTPAVIRNYNRSPSFL